MRQLMRFLLGGLVAGAALAAACKTDSVFPATPGEQTGPKATGGTFEAFTVDLIQNHTADNTNPVNFTTLGLTDSGDPHAFDSLFSQ